MKFDSLTVGLEGEDGEEAVSPGNKLINFTREYFIRRCLCKAFL